MAGTSVRILTRLPVSEKGKNLPKLLVSHELGLETWSIYATRIHEKQLI